MKAIQDSQLITRDEDDQVNLMTDRTIGFRQSPIEEDVPAGQPNDANEVNKFNARAILNSQMPVSPSDAQLMENIE